MPSDLFLNPFSEAPDGLRVLAFGDVVGTAGVNALCTVLPRVIENAHPDIVIANGENANGFGLLPANARKLNKAGVDVITGGNHTFRPADAHQMLEENPFILRPGNLAPATSPGHGVAVFSTKHGPVGVVNLAGQVFMDPADNPFRALQEAVAELKLRNVKVIVVDFHAEATGEKAALAHHADGSVSLVFGTHTHVPTADARILPAGTGFISDVGMCGSHAGIIGMEPDTILRRHLTGLPGRYNPDTRDCRVMGVAAVADPITGACRWLHRVEWIP